MTITHYLPSFFRVAETSSFTQAAEDLGIPKASVSNAIKQLETHLGTRLFHRTTRKVVLTQDGEVFLERSKDLMADLDELSTLFHQDSQPLSGRVRVDMPIAIAREMVIPALPALLAQHPALELELSSTDRKVDPVREGIDFVIRVGNTEDDTLVARKIGDYEMISCVSPDYIQRYGKPKTIASLSQHQLIGYVGHFGKRSAYFEYVDAAGEAQLLSMPCSLFVNSTDAYFAACLAGLGIIQVPNVSGGLQKAIRKGRLIAILTQHPVPTMPVTIVYANRRHLPKRVQFMMDWMVGLIRPKLNTKDDF